MKPLFESPLTDQEFYWCGLLHADGCLSGQGSGRRLVFTQSELEPVEMFLAFLGQESKITYSDRIYGYGRSQNYRASTNKGIVALDALGVKRSVNPLLLRNPHFWRGLIDGDGSVLINGNGYPTIGLCSGKPDDIVAFSDWVGKLFGCKGPKPYKGKTAWYAYLSGGKATLLGQYLYEGQYSALLRKSTIAQSFKNVGKKTRAVLTVPA